MTPPELAPLFQPLAVRGLTLRNRFVMPAMQRGFMDDGAPTQRMVEYLGRCAAGGVGLVICESTAPDHPAAFWSPVMGRIDARTLPAWQRVINAVQREGARVFIQLWHPGVIRKLPADHPLAHHDTLSPSGLVQSGRPHGRAMGAADFSELTAAYAKAARDVQQIGADGIEIHAAHGYLLDQFLWAETNQRSDEYGGATLAARARYPAQVVSAVRAAVGASLPLSVRFSQFKEVDYGATIAASPTELRDFVHLMQSAGVDLFNVSSRRFTKAEWPTSEHPTWSIAEWTRSFAEACVMTCGSVGLNLEMFANLFDDQEPDQLSVERDLAEVAARILRGSLDLVGVGRMHIANPDFVNRVLAGQFAALQLFNKQRHLAELGNALEAEGPGLVTESRDNSAPD
jgi:2,4-dienoyl-CoA reductase-like NADH-dependent reductase (Old Yellow Enzyme family)